MFINSSSHVEMYCTFLQIWLLAIIVFTFTFMHLADAYPKRLTLHSSYSFYILSALAFPGNRTHDLGVVSTMLYHLSYRKAIWAIWNHFIGWIHNCARQLSLLLEWKCKIMERLSFRLFMVLYSKPDSVMKRKVLINAWRAHLRQSVLLNVLPLSSMKLCRRSFKQSH